MPNALQSDDRQSVHRGCFRRLKSLSTKRSSETSTSMRHLVWKDLYLQKWMMGIMFLNTILLSSVFRTSEPYFAGALLGYILMIAVGGFDGKNSDALLNSLPLQRWEIVGAKYLSSLAYVPLIVLALCFFKAIAPRLGIGWYTSMSLADLILRITSLIAIVGLYWPAYFAWDLKKSRYWNFVALSIFWTVFPILHSVVASLIPGKPNPLGAAVVMTGLVAVLTGVSFWLSVGFYIKREF